MKLLFSRALSFLYSILKTYYVFQERSLEFFPEHLTFVVVVVLLVLSR